MYGCKSWTVKKAECRRIDALELWCWRRLLRVPWTARRSNQSILKEISPGCLEGMMLKLKLQYFGHLMQRVDSMEKTLMLGGIGGRRSQNYGFSSGHIWMWELNYKESWGPKNWCFWTVVLEKTLESPLDCKEIQPIHSKGDEAWVFGRNDAKAEAPVLWPSHAKEELTHWKRLWCWEGLGAGGKGMTEDEMAGWHHRLNGHEFE